MSGGTRPGFGRVESKHPYRTERGTVQEGLFALKGHGFSYAVQSQKKCGL